MRLKNSRRQEVSCVNMSREKYFWCVKGLKIKPKNNLSSSLKPNGPPLRGNLFNWASKPLRYTSAKDSSHKYPRHKCCFGDRVTYKTTDMDHVMMLWSLLIDSSLQQPDPVICVSFRVIFCTTVLKQRWTENMSGGRLIAIAVDPSDYSEKAFDCEF